MRYPDNAAVVPANYYRTQFSCVHLLDPLDDSRMLCGWQPEDPHLIGHPVDFHWTRNVDSGAECKACKRASASKEAKR